MSGHSKWANIKNKKAKGDAAKANTFTKIGREIAVAVKQGGPDPSINAKLADVIRKAKKSNMPNDRIQNGIKKASGEGESVNYEELVYEGYGIEGTAVIVETLTDNKNRTGGDIRYVFDKSGGQLGKSGSVSYMFDRKGIVVVEKEGAPDFDTMMEYCLDAGADDISETDDCYEILCEVANFSECCKYLENKNIDFASKEIEWIPQNTVELSPEKYVKFEKMLDRFDDLDDVQNVYHNCSNEE